MRLITGRNHPHFNLDNAAPLGPKYVIRPARDPIAREPEDEQIKLLLKTNLCRARLHEGAWEITSVTGTIISLDYSASFAHWKQTCENLLLESLRSSPDQPDGDRA